MALKWIGLTLWLLAPTMAQAEDISVTGTRPVQVDTYRGVARIFRRFNAFPDADRAGLSLRMTAVLAPGHQPVQQAMPFLAEESGAVPLFATSGDEMRLPDSATLWAQNPPVMARLATGQRITLGFRIVVAGFSGDRFTRMQATGWLQQLDACIADEAGPVAAFLLPDTHRLSVQVAPGARLEVREGETAQLLVVNGGTTPYRFAFRPQDFPRGAVFVSSRAFGTVFMEIPFAVHGTWQRGAGRGTYRAG